MTATATPTPTLVVTASRAVGSDLTYRLPNVSSLDLPDHLCGLSLSVLRPVGAPEIGSGGISHTYRNLVLVGTVAENAPAQAGERVTPLALPSSRVVPPGLSPINRHSSMPVALATRNGVMSAYRTAHLVPVTFDPDTDHYVTAHAWSMFGGNYAVGDSRFSQLVTDALRVPHFYGAVAVHDHVEGE